jgi:hypothetical protein
MPPSGKLLYQVLIWSQRERVAHQGINHTPEADGAVVPWLRLARQSRLPGNNQVE